MWPTTLSPISLFFSPTTHLLHFFPLTCSDLTYSIFTSFLFLLNAQSLVVHLKIHACINVLQFESVNTLLEGPPKKFLEDLNSWVLGVSVEANCLEKKKKKDPFPLFLFILFFFFFFSPSILILTDLFHHFSSSLFSPQPTLTDLLHHFFFFIFFPSNHPHRLRDLQPVLYNPFRSGRNGRKISYRHANRYESPLCSTSAKISACSDLFRPFRLVSAGNPISAGLLFKPLPTVSVTSSRLQQSSPVHLRLFFFFFFFFLLPSSSFFRPALSLSLYLFFTFFFCFLVQVPWLPWSRRWRKKKDRRNG